MGERVKYNLLFGGSWPGTDDRVWHTTTFSKNQDRLLDSELFSRFLESVLAIGRKRNLLHEEHISVDGTLKSSYKRFRSQDEDENGPRGNGCDFRGDVRSDESRI